MQNQFVEVARFNFPSDPAFIHLTIELEAAGIAYICPERTQLENQPFMSVGLGGLRVLVNTKDVKTTQKILADLASEMESPENAEPDEADIELANLLAQQEKTNKAMHYGCLAIIFIIVVSSIFMLFF